ncbi:SUMF1/EgtB/PvdO family nonheme iron enzyme [bacterium]|nr:SUMF1/EgtB/PvdO family nonheme iron enzyme [bacterium]
MSCRRSPSATIDPSNAFPAMAEVRCVMFRIVVVCSLCLWGLAVPAFAQTPKKYALLVAVTTYEHAHLNQPPKIQYPEADAQAIAAIPKAAGYEVDLLLGEKATHKAVETALTGLTKKGNQPGVVVLGFFGHGVEYDELDKDRKPTSRSCFCPYDCTMRKRLDNGRDSFDKQGQFRIEPDPAGLVSMTRVFEALALSPAGNRVLMADCCRDDPHAARAAGRGFGTGIKTGDLPEHANTAALFACSKGEQALEDRTSGHGVFTKCVLDWLQNPQGRVTANELALHVDEAVPQLVSSLTDGRQQQQPKFLNAGRVSLHLSPRAGFSGTKAGELKVLNGVNFRWCPAGRFTMGSPASEQDRIEDETQVSVELSQGFWLQETEVTQGQYRGLMGSSSWSREDNVKEGDDYTASYVSHDDALGYCVKLTEREHSGGRLSLDWQYALPTEAQWEYACRAGTTTVYSFGNDAALLSEYGWYDKNAYFVKEAYAHRVGLKRANAWGLKDMHGNVWEWCGDWYGTDLPGGRDPRGPSSGSDRVIRGGGWRVIASFCRSASHPLSSPGGAFHEQRLDQSPLLISEFGLWNRPGPCRVAAPLWPPLQGKRHAMVSFQKTTACNSPAIQTHNFWLMKWPLGNLPHDDGRDHNLRFLRRQLIQYCWRGLGARGFAEDVGVIRNIPTPPSIRRRVVETNHRPGSRAANSLNPDAPSKAGDGAGTGQAQSVPPRTSHRARCRPVPGTRQGVRFALWSKP